ncbi:MAG: NADH-quinone oxidoreductase subunit J [Pirellulales bacterium]|nr:NADH-quinone oxidoreductase subunit J [Pirellulales bacterium]
MDGHINWHSFYFLLFGLTACVFSVAVVLTGSIVRMAFYLTLCLGATAGLFFLAGAGFVGAMQLLIYVGGTLVLLIFGVMLTAQGPFVNMKTRAGEWVIGGAAGLMLLGLLLQAAFRVEEWRGPPEGVATATAENAPPGEIGIRMLGKPGDNGKAVGKESGYLLPFEIVSVHLLVVLIGSAYLARTKRRRRASDPAEST